MISNIKKFADRSRRAIVLAAVLRIGAVLVPRWSLLLIHLAALAWIAAFGGFAALYGPALFRARRG